MTRTIYFPVSVRRVVLRLTAPHCDCFKTKVYQAPLSPELSGEFFGRAELPQRLTGEQCAMFVHNKCIVYQFGEDRAD